MAESESSRALRTVLATPSSQALRDRFGRIQLWRWASGRRKPSAAAIAQLHNLTKGRVRADGWY
jgi:hypothetical protein